MTRKCVGYGKIGRVFEMDPRKWGVVGGDHEAPVLLRKLAERNPDVEWYAIGRNSGWASDMPNVTNPWREWAPQLKFKKDTSVRDMIMRYDEVTMPLIESLDGIALWLGQHGTSNSPIRKVEDRSAYTSPQISFVHYTAFLLRGINRWRMSDPLEREEVWLLSDVRNYIKGRDLKWPRRHPILSQYDFARWEWCERYGDDRSPQMTGFSDCAKFDHPTGMWRVHDMYEGSGLEVSCLSSETRETPWEDRKYGYGVLINEARNYGMKPEMARVNILPDYVINIGYDWIHGSWTEESQAKMGVDIAGIPYWEIFDKLGQTKCSLTTPTSGSGWATPKPLEMWQCGVVCFFHPRYDDQGHILPTLAQIESGKYDSLPDLVNLTKWLRVTDPEQLSRRIDAVESSRETYEWLADTQRKLLNFKINENRAIKQIERRLGL